MKTLLSSFAAAILISSCSYTTNVMPEPKPAPVAPVIVRRSSPSPKPTPSSSVPDTFQAITKPSSYSN